MRRRMAERGLASAREQLSMARDLGVRMFVCQASLELLGLTVDELVDYPGLEVCGATAFLAQSAERRAMLVF